MAVCAGIKADGGRCKAQAIRDSQWCFNHHPDYEEQRRRRGSRGGRRGGRGRPQTELNDIKARIRGLIEAVKNGELTRADAAVIGQLYNLLLSCLKIELQVREQEDVERRVEELETILAHQNQRSYRGGQTW